jgi:glutathione S-transferase
MNDVILRYFDCLGRAQPLRHALIDAGVAFDDVRVPQAEWPQHKADKTFAGPFGGLPTLSFGGATVAETLPVASFLARRLGHYDGLEDAAIARLEAISSNCYIEIMLRSGELIYADYMYPGADVGGALPGHMGRMLEKIGGVEALSPEGGWFGGARPVMADFFAGEAVEVLRYMLGPAREEALLSRLPRLSALATRVRSRPALAGAWQSRPARFTSRPDEAEVVERLRAADLSSVGFTSARLV